MHNQTSLRGLGRNHFNLSVLKRGTNRAAENLLSEHLFIHQQKSLLALEK